MDTTRQAGQLAVCVLPAAGPHGPSSPAERPSEGLALVGTMTW